MKVYEGKVLVSNRPAYAIEGATKATRKQVAGPTEISKKQWMEAVAGAMQLITVAANGEMSQPTGFELANVEAEGGKDDWEA
ncbi:MAG: hypothetical protein R3C68_07815 [Myxococcota bacterium]